jgi:histone acetyltransferase 1
MSENLKRNSTQNIDPNSSTSNFEMPRKKKSKLGIQKEEEISAGFISNSNEVIYFKIIHSEEEFKNFQNLTNLEHCFNPQFTNQIFENELITGYKNLKILISLTPRFFFPHFKIIYDKCLKVKDDIELILKNHFDNLFETNEAKYLEKLKYDLGDSESIFENDESRSDRPFITFPPKGKLISEGKLDDKKLAIYHINVVKDKFTEENFNYQCICTFFIDGASFIPYEDSFWSYYIIYEMIQDNQEMENPKKLRFNVLGYTTTLNVNLSLNSHRTMVSQFLVLPPFQRKGLGHFLLDVNNFLVILKIFFLLITYIESIQLSIRKRR